MLMPCNTQSVDLQKGNLFCFLFYYAFKKTVITDVSFLCKCVDKKNDR